MTSPNYDYHGLLASTWDLSRGDTSNWSDRQFYLEIVRKFGQPVLDIGSGTGRILLDFASLGIDIDGVDNSPEMLAICREKMQTMRSRATVYEQGVESLDLPRTYRTILAPSSTMQLLTDAGAARQAMRRCFEHLHPGGAFVTPFGFAWRDGEPLDSGWKQRFEQLRPEDGATVRSFEREWREPDQQLWHTEERFEVTLNGKVIAAEHHRRSPEGRWYTQRQAIELFREAGYADVQAFHEFEIGTSAREDDRLFSVLGVRR